jgi:hypothetical protein
MKKLMVALAVAALFMFFLLGSSVKAQDFCKGNFDYDKDVDGSDASTFKQDFGRSALLDPCPPDGPAPVEKSWQSPSYATGDDGYYHKGVSWGIRFTDNGNGTVTDNLTGLIWLKDADCFSSRYWNDALIVCNGLASGSCGLTDGSSPGDWRLPNVKEMTSLIDYDYTSPAIHQYYYFNNVISGLYWTSTTDIGNTIYAWIVSTILGEVYPDRKEFFRRVWPVRGGHNF